MKKNMIKNCFILALFILIPKMNISAQVFENDYVSESLSPNASNTQNIKTDLFRGRCSIGIPLFGLKGDNMINVPIALEYTTPKETNSSLYPLHPGWTGMGWSLSAGGAISLVSSRYSDEIKKYSFNFCGYSGFLYRRSDGGDWIISSDNNFIIDGIRYDTNYNLIGIKLQTIEGIIYTFGYNMPDYNAVEYSTQLRTLQPARIPTSLFLVKIESPAGASVNFRYEQGPSICSIFTNYEYIHSTTTYDNGTYDYDVKTPSDADKLLYGEYDGYIIEPVYLSSMGGGSNWIQFHRSVVTEKNYSPEEMKICYYNNRGFQSYIWYKLDSITFAENSTVFKKFRLGFSNDSSEILKLQSVQEVGVKNNILSTKPAYQFNYNHLSILNKIIYPTGGVTTFEFEQNKYPWIQGNYSSYRLAKGYRIKEIASYNSVKEDDDPTITHYYYIKDEHFNKSSPINSDYYSSGVISRESRYEITDNFSPGYPIWVNYTKTSSQDTPPYPGAPDPDEVGYTDVFVEKRKRSQEEFENGYTRHIFSNYGINLHPTKIGPIINDYPYSGDFRLYREYEIGRLRQYTEYGSHRGILKQVYYDYVDTERKIDTVMLHRARVMPFIWQGRTISYVEADSALHYFCGKYYPKRIIETVGLAENFRTTIYKYNPELGHVISEEVVGSDGNSYTTEYKYIFNSLNDIINGPQWSAYNKPYEIVTKKNGNVIAAEVTRYEVTYNTSYPYITWLTPRKVFRLNSSTPLTDYQPALSHSINSPIDSRYELETDIFCNGNGSIRMYQHTGQRPVYIESDSYLRPVRQVVGATDTEVANAYGRLLNKSDEYSRAMEFRNLLPDAYVTDYEYNIHGVTSIIDPKGAVQKTEYDSFGQVKRTSIIKNGVEKTIQEYEYHYKNEE